MNLKLRKVELKTTDKTDDESALQKSADFIQAFVLGFEVQDAVALLRLDDLYLECFEVKDVKQTLRGEHMSRGIGRLAGRAAKPNIPSKTPRELESSSRINTYAY